jgi:hypothetical protein
MEEKRPDSAVSFGMALLLVAMGLLISGFYAVAMLALAQATGPAIPIIIWALASILTVVFIFSLRHGNPR